MKLCVPYAQNSHIRLIEIRVFFRSFLFLLSATYIYFFYYGLVWNTECVLNYIALCTTKCLYDIAKISKKKFKSFVCFFFNKKNLCFFHSRCTYINFKLTSRILENRLRNIVLCKKRKYFHSINKQKEKRNET